MQKIFIVQKISFLPNYASFAKNEIPSTTLKSAEGKRIIFLANLKHPKNHLFAIKAFSETALVSQGWTFHLIGKIFDGKYFASRKSVINEEQLSKAVFFYRSYQDIKNILSQGNIGIVVSTSEGFPVVILEYAKVKLVVVSANVGHCATIIENGQSGFFLIQTIATILNGN